MPRHKLERQGSPAPIGPDQGPETSRSRPKHIARGRPESGAHVPLQEVGGERLPAQGLVLHRGASTEDLRRVDELEARAAGSVLSWPLAPEVGGYQGREIVILAERAGFLVGTARAILRQAVVPSSRTAVEVSRVLQQLGTPVACVERLALHPRLQSSAPVIFRALERLAVDVMLARGRGILGFGRDFDLGLLGRLGFRPVAAPVETAAGWLNLVELPLCSVDLEARDAALAPVVRRAEKVRDEYSEGRPGRQR